MAFKIINLIKTHFLFIIMLSILSWTLSPALFSVFPADSYVELGISVNDFGKQTTHLSLTNVPLNYYLSQYGVLTTLNMLAYKLFEFNSMAYFALNISLRILAAVSIYYFVAKWGRSKLAGFVAGTYFGVSYPGIENTTRVTLFTIYLAIIFMFIFLDKWLDFHAKPSFNTALSSIIYLILSIVVYPVRMVGTTILLIAGETYWLINKFNDKAKFGLRMKHLATLMITLFIMILVSGTLSPTPEIQFKMVSPKILFLALITGYPPVITSLWLFISNMIISPIFFQERYLSLIIMQTYSIILPLSGVIFLFFCLTKRKFLLAFASITVITFSLFISESARNLTGWKPSWIVSTQFGGTIFILCTLITFYMWNQQKRLAQMGLLGIFLALSNLLVPWMLAPVSYYDVQSIFDFSLRYYTLPSVGIAILIGCIFTFFIESFYRNTSLILPLLNPLRIFKLVKITIFSALTMLLPLSIVGIIYLQSFTVHNLLTLQSQSTNEQKVNLFWNGIKGYFKNDQNIDNPKTVYVENDDNLNEKYIKELFPTRISIYLGRIAHPPQVNFIFNKEEAMKSLKDSSLNPASNFEFYAFRFTNNNVLDITSEFLKTAKLQ